MKMREKEISRELVFEGRLYRVWKTKVQLDDGSVADREHLENKAGSVSAVVLDISQNIYLVKEYRSAAKEVQIHLPGGGFVLGKELPEDAIVREVREEIGLRSRKVEKLFELHGGASWTWPQYCFLCEDLVDDPLKGDWDEKIEVIKMPFQDYLHDALENKIGRYGDFKAAILVAKKLGLLDIKP